MKSTEHRKSLIGIFALSFILTFFVDGSKPIELNFWGVRIEEGYIWLSLLMAQIYFCAMAYTEGVFSGIEREKHLTIFQYVWKNPGMRTERVGQFMRTWFSTGIAALTAGIILWGLYSSITQNADSARTYWC